MPNGCSRLKYIPKQLYVAQCLDASTIGSGDLNLTAASHLQNRWDFSPASSIIPIKSESMITLRTTDLQTNFCYTSSHLTCTKTVGEPNLSCGHLVLNRR